MARKLTRQQAMAEIIDALCPIGPYLGLEQAEKLASVCEAVAGLYERGGKLYDTGLGLRVKPAATKADFWQAIEETTGIRARG